MIFRVICKTCINYEIDTPKAHLSQQRIIHIFGAFFAPISLSLLLCFNQLILFNSYRSHTTLIPIKMRLDMYME